MRYALAYLVSAVVFLAMDVAWLTLMGQRLYQTEIGQLLAKSVRPVPAVGFYLIYVTGMVFFAVRPALASGQLTTAIVNGVALGLVCYATYDLTAQATMAVWSVKVTLYDLAWGMLATGASATAATAVTLKVFGK
jgi:uncharacterized membrane protein